MYKECLHRAEISTEQMTMCSDQLPSLSHISLSHNRNISLQSTHLKLLKNIIPENSF